MLRPTSPPASPSGSTVVTAALRGKFEWESNDRMRPRHEHKGARGGEKGEWKRENDEDVTMQLSKSKADGRPCFRHAQSVRVERETRSRVARDLLRTAPGRHVRRLTGAGRRPTVEAKLCPSGWQGDAGR